MDEQHQEAVETLRPFPEAYARFAAQHDSNDMRLFAVGILLLSLASLYPGHDHPRHPSRSLGMGWDRSCVCACMIGTRSRIANAWGSRVYWWT